MTGIWISDASASGAIFAFLIGGLFMVYVGLIYTDVMTAYPSQGGEFGCARLALGNAPALVIAWSLLLMFVSGLIFEGIAMAWLVESFIDYINQRESGHQVLTSLKWISSLTTLFIVILIALRGVKTSASVQTVLVCLLVIGIIFLLISAISYGQISNLMSGLQNIDTADYWGGFGRILITVPIWFAGFNTLLQAARGSDKSPRTLGKIAILVILGAGFVHVVSIVATGALAPMEGFQGENTRPGVFIALQGSSLEGFIIPFIYIGGVCGLLSTAIAMLTAGSQLLAEVARNGLAPAIFASTGNNGSAPVFSILSIGLFAILGVILSNASGASGQVIVLAMITAGSMGMIIVYLIMCVIACLSTKGHPLETKKYNAAFKNILLPLTACFLAGCLVYAIYDSFHFSDSYTSFSLIMFFVWFLFGATMLFLHDKCKDRWANRGKQTLLNKGGI